MPDLQDLVGGELGGVMPLASDLQFPRTDRPPLGMALDVLAALGRHVARVVTTVTEKEVVGSNTRRVVAVVEDTETGRYRTPGEPPRDPVCKINFARAV
jgi:hypothetical protein